MDDEGQNSGSRIAIVGMSVRLPGAATLDAFWRNLEAGVESISVFSREELLASALDPRLIELPNYVPARAILPDLENFDAAFFGVTPRDAALIDPQQRLLLECSQEALEASGCARDAEKHPCGVFCSVGMNGYLLHNLWPHRALFESTAGFQAMLGNDKDFAATRVSYKLNLRGPSLTVQTACSSSLTAVHLACQALLNGDCDLALAGGSTAFVPQRSGYLHEPGMILSPDGHCRPFDARAAGTVAGNGAAMIVLKRLDDALAAGDSIHAVILGSAVNNDGSVKVGYTAPSEEGQRAVISEALAVSGVTPELIGYVETHGTGTPQGDPIEFSALKRAFTHGETRRGRCALGSVKSNLGHLDVAAGVVGLVKAALAVQHGRIPRTLHFERPNPAIDMDNSPFFIPTTTVPWDRDGVAPRRAGVSSFGIGGSNVHVVIEEAPRCRSAARSRPRHDFVLSANSAPALDTAARELSDWLEAHDEHDLADVAYTWNSGRRLHAHRRLISAATRTEAIRQLRLPPQANNGSLHEASERTAVFMFPGQGTQFSGMGRGLYETEPLFRQELDRCADLLRHELSLDLRDVVFHDTSDVIRETRLAQPSLFAVEYALARCLMAWGVRPRALMGHSLGEWVAACIAGVLTLEEALPLIALRGRLMQDQPRGAMLGVHLGEAALTRYLSPQIALAAVNAPALCAVAGSFDAIAALEQQLGRDGVGFTRLETSHAFHSAMMDPAVEPMREAMAQVRLRPPRIRILSNVTGRWLTPEEATNPLYWAQQLRVPVRCADGLELLFRDADQALIEVGPGNLFSKLASQFADRPASQPILPMLPPSARPSDEAAHLVTTMARLHGVGLPVDWQAFHADEGRRRISLPTHPMKKERCWIESLARSEPDETRRPQNDWLYLPGWRRSQRPQTDAGACQGVWILAGNAAEPLLSRLADRLREGGGEVVVLAAWPTSPDDWRAVVSGKPSLRGIILFEGGDGIQQFLSLGALARSLPGGPLTIALITRELNRVGGHEDGDPRRVLALGALRVLPQEERGITCRQIDLDNASWEGSRAAVDTVMDELLGDHVDEIAVYRGVARWVPSFERIAAPRAGARDRLRERGTYLITGGLGGIGLTLAEALAKSHRARMVLVSRSSFPARTDWERLAANADTRAGRQARRLLAIEAAGGEIVIETADVTDETQMANVVEQAAAHYGAIHGVVHSAGVPGGGVLAGKSEQAVRDILKAKVEGAGILARLFENPSLDFMVVCSSVSGWLGGYGQADYCAANLFLDAFADARSRRGQPTVSILWDTWRDVGMAVETDLPPELRHAREEELSRFALSPAEGVAAFYNALSLDLPQVVVSTREFNARYAARLALPAGGEDAIVTTPEGARHPRPPLASPFVAPTSDTERRLAEIWAAHFGYSEIGINDNYFDLGGDSLKCIMLSDALQREFGETVRVATFFELPTIAELAQRFDQPKRMLDLRLTDDGIAALPRNEGETAFEMSSGQRRLWFLHMLEPESTAYHMPAAMRIRGPLDTEALTQSHREIIKRHEALRTVFSMNNGKPMQVVRSEVIFDLPFVDLSDLHASGRETRVEQLTRDCARRPFDLESGPLLRALVIRFAPDDHLWVFVVHHIVSDAWSMDVFVRETTAFYCALTGQGPVELPALPIQYANYASWQAERQNGEEAARSLAYWRETLAGAPPLLELPTDRPRPARRTHAGARVRFVLDANLASQLKLLARETGGTLFTVLIAAFTTLLSRLSGEKDLVIGTPIAGRNRPELSPSIGFFINTLVLRFDLTGQPTFRDHLARTQRLFLDALTHQETPFDLLVETLQPPRNLSCTPLFQVMFAFMNERPAAFNVPELTFEPSNLVHESSAFDLTLLMREDESGLADDFEYSVDLFDEATVHGLGRRFERVLRSAVQNPNTRIGNARILEPEEPSQLLGIFNATRSDIAAVTWPALFEAQVARTPDAPALVFGAQSISYRDLNERANRLARQLVHRGIGPEDLVGVCLERSFDMFTALLGIMKAGAAYVPLDPEYPASRLAFMIEDAAPALVFCSTESKRKLPLSAMVQVLEDAEAFSGDDLAQTERRTPLLATHPAYVIYTSGSTGRPKGVVVTHLGLASLAEVHVERLKLTPLSRVLQFASFSFDSSVVEFVMTFAAGAALVLIPAEERGGTLLSDLIHKQQVTVAQLPPVVLATLSADDDLRLDALIVAGEACPGELVERWSRQTRMFNAYGPTESTVAATLSEALSGGGPPPIGRPIWNTRIYILDDAMQLVPVGVCGQIYIAGLGLARGYLRRPSLTAERFIPDPFGGTGERMYATGDLARWRRDGTIDYLGRIDQQVKLRGFRIEPGEIETAIAAQPGVAQTVVLPRDTGTRGKQLVAYIVSLPGTEPDIAALRRALRDSLPDYMVPTAWVSLPSLPLTPNGKLDRAALPVPEQDTGSHAEPTTPTEEMLCKLFAEVLSIPRVGVSDNFFDLGGDSILSLQVASRARTEGLWLSTRQLFEHQTITELARVVRPIEQGDVAAESVGAIPLTPIQHWFFEQNFVEPQHFNQAVMLEVVPDLSAAWLREALQSLVTKHEGLRTRFVGSEGIVVASAEASVVDVLVENGTDIEARAALLQASLSLETGTLMRMALFPQAQGEPTRLLWIVHHLVVDGVSWRILLRDLDAALRSIAAGQAPSEERPTVSFGAWAQRLESLAGGTKLNGELDYWRRLARKRPRALPREAETDGLRGEAKIVSVELDSAETATLLRDTARLFACGHDELLLTAVTRAFMEWTGERQVLIDVETHGRGADVDLDLSTAVGWFTTVYPICLSCDERLPLIQQVRQVHEQLAEVPEHGIGYGLLRYQHPDAAVRHEMSILPRPELLFNYFGQLDQALPPSPYLLRRAQEDPGPMASPRQRRTHLIEVNAWVAQGRLVTTWTYHEACHSRRTMEAISEAFTNVLRGCVAAARSTVPTEAKARPSERTLEDDKLARLAAALQKADRSHKGTP